MFLMFFLVNLDLNIYFVSDYLYVSCPFQVVIIVLNNNVYKIETIQNTFLSYANQTNQKVFKESDYNSVMHFLNK